MPMMFYAFAADGGRASQGRRGAEGSGHCCGHGIYGISVAKAKSVGADLCMRLEECAGGGGGRNAQAMGVGDRYHLLPGSAFDVDFGSGYDLALVTNFCITSIRLPVLVSCARFMLRCAPGGRAAIH